MCTIEIMEGYAERAQGEHWLTLFTKPYYWGKIRQNMSQAQQLSCTMCVSECVCVWELCMYVHDWAVYIKLLSFVALIASVCISLAHLCLGNLGHDKSVNIKEKKTWKQR